AGRKSTGGAPARLRLSVSGGRASRKIVPFATSASRRIRPPAPSRATSSMVGGGAAASSNVQIAVSTVDFPLEASPTSAQTEPGESSSSRAARYPWMETRLSGGGTYDLTAPTAHRDTPPGRRAASAGGSAGSADGERRRRAHWDRTT